MKAIIFAITLLAIVSSQKLATDDDFAQTGLEFTFECVEKDFRFGEEHTCEMKLVNKGSKTVRVGVVATPLDARHSIMMN